MPPRRDATRLPPGPPGRPLVGHLPEFARDTLGFVEALAAEHGDVASFRLAGWRAYLLNHPDHVGAVLVDNHRNFVKHNFFWRHVRAIFGRGLLTNEGEPWLHQRRLIQPAFRHDRVAAYGRYMVDFTERRISGWRDGEIRDVREEMTSLTFEIVAKVLFDAGVAEDLEEIAEAFDTGIEQIAARIRRPVRIPDWIPTPGNLRYRAAVARMDRLIARILEEHREGRASEDDVLSRLMEARDERGEPMSEKQLRDEVITLLLAGHETTALALTWTWWLLAEHPEIADRVAGEARRVAGDRPLEVGDAPRLGFAGKVFRESLRLYPPAYSFGREAVEDCEIGGWDVPAGTTLFVFPWLLHRDERWFEEPLAFDPGRWDGDLEKRLPRHAYIPFGSGPRLCIGQDFARLEAVLILSTIARRFRLEWTDGPPEPSPSITLRPTGDLRVRLRQRT
ncbi:MAG: cytochrome P450 [Gemmatimonadota bacterium]|nr:cytochrome P450 [Gemmatimonadota bacterium]